MRCEHYNHYADWPYHGVYGYPIYGRPEPWSRRRVITTWVVSAMFAVAGLAALPAMRNATERSWCGSGEGPVSTTCLAEQKAIRCGPFGVFHCPPGGD